ncbi:MAG: MFS transporter [Alloprevotella sp.]|nr:MFS transporter [Bacteroidales bacterium]MDD6075257.1 MFS transporter [Bacteroidales bacterium]MDD6554397.1 MFS transporter [Bacteroidales bacterium]MDY3802210.1 MFS transporter [Alloprevotella sp.]MDY4564450.1 MFS transporter [Alloprevotella sp.]
MSNQKKQWGAIIVMIALFAMIAFVTNLCNPMAKIIKNQGEISTVLAQIGNYGNFVAYLIMGIPAGMLISKFGYKKTALTGLVVGAVGILIQWFSGQLNAQENLGLVFAVYLIGAFIAGLCMCILNCVVNPMLNLLGGGGNKGNQLIQIGGVFNSAAAVACYILMGALIADMSKAKIADATPALMIALAIFVIAFVVILFTKIDEPEQAPVRVDLIVGALGFRHFALGLLAIFLYMGIEVGVPSYVGFYLTEDMKIPENIVGLLVAVYWFMMLIGRLVGASIGGKVSARAMITTVSTITLALVLFGMYAPTDILVACPGVDWGKLELIWQEVPLGIFAFLLVGLCTSVMWGGIFNMAVEGLGKYTAIASGLFMTMVFGCAVMMFIQALVADATNYITSFWVVVFCAAYILFYALIGSRVNKRA